MIKRLLCWLIGGHFVRRRPEVTIRPRLSWRTRLKCWCGRTDYYEDGLVNHPK